jgi:hypothetical protein
MNAQMYAKALQNIKDRFLCANVPRYIDNPLHPGSRVFAVLSRIEVIREANRNVYKYIYDFHRLVLNVLDLNQVFRNNLERFFAIELAKTFSIENKSKDYLKMLFTYFVHDGNVAPHSIQAITIDSIPREIHAESISIQYKRESRLYSQPTAVFGEKIENWDTQLEDDITLGGQRYPKAKRNDLISGDLLRQQQLDPLLRHLIKLWIIHQVVQPENQLLLEENDFFNVTNLEQTILDLQTSITKEIEALLAKPIQQRQNETAVEARANRYHLSPVLYDLTQRIPLLKFIVGHSINDIHSFKEANTTPSSRMKYFLRSHLNLSLSQYLFKKSKNAFIKSKATLKDFIAGETRARSLFMAFFKLLKSVYIMLWLPFLGSFFTLMGLTSLPFSLIRKASNISLGGSLDKIITAIESVKDLFLLTLMVPVLYSIFLTGSAMLLGTGGVNIAAILTLATLCTVMSPLFLLALPNSFLEYPRWVQLRGVWHYQEQSEYDLLKSLLTVVSSIRIVNIHVAIATTAFVLFSTVAFGGRLLKKALDFFVPQKLLRSDLQFQLRNLNHSPQFRKTLAELNTRMETNACTTVDYDLLVNLQQCKLTSHQKSRLKDYLSKQVESDETEDRRTYTLALSMIDHPAFLPSWKLVNRLNEALPAESDIDPSLREAIQKANEVYSTRLNSYV